MINDSFNPYEHLSVYHDADGNPILENLEDNGKPVSMKGEDGKFHSVLIPRRYLNSNAYREWFRCRYPDGCIDVEDLTLPAMWNGSVFVDSPEYKVKVTLFEDKAKTLQIASSYGIIRKTYKPDPVQGQYIPEYSDSKNTFELAQSIGIRNAMLNAGFLYDPSASVLKEKDAQYLNVIIAGPALDFAPAMELPSFGEESLEEENSAPVSASGNDEILDYLREMSSAQENPVQVESKTPSEDMRDVIFTTLEGANDQLKRFNGMRIGDIDEGTVTYLGTRNWDGKLTEETINALAALC